MSLSITSALYSEQGLREWLMSLKGQATCQALAWDTTIFCDATCTPAIPNALRAPPAGLRRRAAVTIAARRAVHAGLWRVSVPDGGQAAPRGAGAAAHLPGQGHVRGGPGQHGGAQQPALCAPASATTFSMALTLQLALRCKFAFYASSGKASVHGPSIAALLAGLHIEAVH